MWGGKCVEQHFVRISHTKNATIIANQDMSTLNLLEKNRVSVDKFQAETFELPKVGRGKTLMICTSRVRIRYDRQSGDFKFSGKFY